MKKNVFCCKYDEVKFNRLQKKITEELNFDFFVYTDIDGRIWTVSKIRVTVYGYLLIYQSEYSTDPLVVNLDPMYDKKKFRKRLDWEVEIVRNAKRLKQGFEDEMPF